MPPLKKLLGISKLVLTEILNNFYKLYPYKVAIHELLEERARIQRKFFLRYNEAAIVLELRNSMKNELCFAMKHIFG